MQAPWGYWTMAPPNIYKQTLSTCIMVRFLHRSGVHHGFRQYKNLERVDLLEKLDLQRHKIQES